MDAPEQHGLADRMKAQAGIVRPPGPIHVRAEFQVFAEKADALEDGTPHQQGAGNPGQQGLVQQVLAEPLRPILDEQPMGAKTMSMDGSRSSAAS